MPPIQLEVRRLRTIATIVLVLAVVVGGLMNVLVGGASATEYVVNDTTAENGDWDLSYLLCIGAKIRFEALLNNDYTEDLFLIDEVIIIGWNDPT